MTARHNIRIGNRRLSRERAAIDATPAPRVGEMLQAARERKGVDLFRAERDTKIRLKYLAALEDSEYAALPPIVYTKGFLRNYAIYLGLEPEEILTRWRDETQVGRKVERPSVAPPPRPIAVPRRGLIISPGLLVALFFSLIVLVFVGWIGVQLMRFADVPELTISSPASLYSRVEAESIVLSGIAGPRAEVTITTPDSRRMTVIADEAGSWSREVELAKGRNDFTVFATDAVTHRQSDPVILIIDVPLPGESPGATTGPTPAPMALSLTGPTDGLSVTNGRVSVRGTTSGTRVTIASTYLGPATGSPTPAASLPPAEPSATPTEPGASLLPSPTPAATAPPLYDLTVDSTGAFNQLVDLPAGRWQITVTASASGVAPLSQVRTVTVRPLVVAAGMTMVITAAKGDCWMRVVIDGTVKKAGEWGGPILERGTSLTITGVAEIYLRTGNAEALDITVNGQSYDLTGSVGNWIFRPGAAPEQTNERR